MAASDAVAPSARSISAVLILRFLIYEYGVSPTIRVNFLIKPSVDI